MWPGKSGCIYLDDVVDEAACALKIDAEGYEPAVVRGALKTLMQRPPRVVLLEYTPGAVERAAATGEAKVAERGPVQYTDFPRMLQNLSRAGYHIWKLNSDRKHLPFRDGREGLELEVDSAAIEAEAVNAANFVRSYSSLGFQLPVDVRSAVGVT